MNTIDKVTNYGAGKLAFEQVLEIWRTLPTELTRVFTRLHVLRINGIVDMRALNRLFGSIDGLKQLFGEIDLYAVTKAQGTVDHFLEWGTFQLTKDQFEFIFSNLFSSANIINESVVSYNLNSDFDRIMTQLRKSDNAPVPLPSVFDMPPRQVFPGEA
jgi:hypothetical protein